MATAELQSSLAAFATFARSLKGDEKSEAQSFLDHFFRALGHPSAIAAGATFEFRIAKKPGSAQLELVVAGVSDPGHSRAKGGKKYGDLVRRKNRSTWTTTPRSRTHRVRHRRLRRVAKPA